METKYYIYHIPGKKIGVTKDLEVSFHAGNRLKEIASIVGGSGGGRPDMAQAGGIHTEKLGEAMERVKEIIRNT